MGRLAAWTVFTLATVLVGLTIAFGVLFMSRLYQPLATAEFALLALVSFSILVTLFAITFAAKLDAREDERIARRAARRGSGRKA